MWHRPPQNCRRTRRSTAPNHAKLTKFLPDCVQKNISLKFAQNCELLPFQKTWRQKWPKGGFFGLTVNEVARAIPKGDWWNVAMVWDGKPLGWCRHCYGNNAVDQGCCKVWGRLRLLSEKKFVYQHRKLYVGENRRYEKFCNYLSRKGIWTKGAEKNNSKNALQLVPVRRLNS